MITHNLKGGIVLTHIPQEKFKTVLLSLSIYRPMGKEAAKNALLARVLKHTCKKYNDKIKLESEFEMLYGAVLGAEVRKCGDVQIISFHLSLPSDKYTGENSLKKAAELLYEIVFNPDASEKSFRDEIVEIDKNNLKNTIEALFNDKREYATVRCSEIMYDGTPYAAFELGSTSELEKITAENLKEHYDNIIENSCISLFLSGNCRADAVKTIFENVKSVGEIPENNWKNRKDKLKTVFEEQEINQGKLVMGFKADIDPSSDDYFKMLLLNSVFGGGTHSKLFANVREKLSLAYYAYSKYNMYKSFLSVGAGIEFSNFEKTKEEILIQFDEVKKGNITDFEIVSAKQTLINLYKSMEDEPHKIISHYTGQNVLEKKRTISEIILKIEAVTKEEIVAISEKVWLDTIYFLKGKGN